MTIFFDGEERLLLLLMFRFRVVVWKLQNVVFIAIPKTLHPATAITTRIHHPRGIPSNNKPKTGTEKYDIILSCPRPPSSSSCFLFSYLLAYAFINKLFHVPHSLLESLPKSQTLKLRRKNLLLLNIIIFFFLIVGNEMKPKTGSLSIVF